MASRLKEDERNEKIIRGLLKLPANRRCINCNSLGPQYVCTNFWTFICTTCSGIHREFTHRVKSVSIAKFTSQEVSSLQAGGNERAKEIYLKEWDSQCQSQPDGSNVERLRDFIKHVYVDKRYTGERSVDRPPRMQGASEDTYDNRRADTYLSDSRSPPYEDTYARRCNERPSPGGRSDEKNYRYKYDERRSPGYDQEVRRFGDYKRSPGRFEAVDARLRDDRFANSPFRRSEEHRSPDVVSKHDVRSPDHQKDVSSPPVVRPVREILGEDVPPLRVGEPSKANGGKSIDVPACAQRTTSSSSLGSTEGNPVELKRVNSGALGTLIDFSVEPVPPVSVPENNIFGSQPVQQSTTMPSADGGNWASFDFAVQEKKPNPPSNANTLESAMPQLVHGGVPASNNSPFPVGGANSLVNTSGGQRATMPQHQPSLLTAPSRQYMPQQFTSVGAGAVPSNQAWGSSSSLNAHGPFTAQLSRPLKTLQELSSGVSSQSVPVEVKATQNQTSLFTAAVSQMPQQITSAGGAPTNQTWGSSSAFNARGPLIAQLPQSAQKTPQELSSGVSSQPVRVEPKATERKELPADLFTITYTPVPVPLPGWQSGPPQVMGYGLQYPATVSMPNFPQPQKSTNPFELSNEPTMVNPPPFPSMASLHGALPNMTAPPMMGGSSFGAPPQWAPPQAYPSAGLTSGYTMQQAPSNIPPVGHQGFAGFGTGISDLVAGQRLGLRGPQPASPNSFPSGGNPFR